MTVTDIDEQPSAEVVQLHPACRRKIEMSPGVQSRDDIPRLAEEREFACIPQWS
jgi:hypothetical protein